MVFYYLPIISHPWLNLHAMDPMDQAISRAKTAEEKMAKEAMDAMDDWVRWMETSRDRDDDWDHYSGYVMYIELICRHVLMLDSWDLIL